MKRADGYYVVIVEDLDSGKVIGSATLVVEQKFIHNCGLVRIFAISPEIRGTPTRSV